MNIIYARVSKEEEKLQHIEDQIPAICEKFNLNLSDVTVLQERGSAYNLNKLHKRKKFLELINILFNAENVTIVDLFKRNIHNKQINLYIWDYARLMRNMEFCLLFSILACLYKIRIFSYKDGLMSVNETETPSIKLSKYLMASIHSYSGEEYSYNISQNIKKTVNKDENITVSNNGKKWGRSMYNLDGEKLSVEQMSKIDKSITSMIKDYEKRGIKYYYPRIIKLITKKYNVKPSKSYISKLYNVYIAE